MCLVNQNDSPRARRMTAIGCACIATALPLRLFLHPSGVAAYNTLDFVVGLLLGISIAINLHAVWIRKHNRENRA